MRSCGETGLTAGNGSRTTVARIGASSVDFHFRILLDEDEVAEARVTKACVDLNTMRPTEIPEDLRKVFEDYSDTTP